jgi:catechol 2,3-dioxygenase-like lactoylglutathione lyase family enzyme
MQIKLASLMVADQDEALRFYTDMLGFATCADIPMGPFRWLTVTSPDGLPGVELVLEPMAFPPARTYQEALYAAGIPATAFITSDIAAEYQRLKEKGAAGSASGMIRGRPPVLPESVGGQ